MRTQVPPLGLVPLKRAKLVTRQERSQDQTKPRRTGRLGKGSSNYRLFLTINSENKWKRKAVKIELFSLHTDLKPGFHCDFSRCFQGKHCYNLLIIYSIHLLITLFLLVETLSLSLSLSSYILEENFFFFLGIGAVWVYGYITGFQTRLVGNLNKLSLSFPSQDSKSLCGLNLLINEYVQMGEKCCSKEGAWKNTQSSPALHRFVVVVVV